MTEIEENSNDEAFWKTSESLEPDVITGYVTRLDDFEGGSQIGDNEDDSSSNFEKVLVDVKQKRLLRPLSLIGSGIVIIGITLLVSFVIHQVKLHHFLAVPIGMGATFIVYGLGWLSFRELQAISRLKNAEALQNEITRLSSTDVSWKEAANAVQHLARVNSTTIREIFINLNKDMKPYHRGSHYFPEFEKLVLGAMDKEAEASIVRAVRDTFFLTVLAQTPIIDTVAFTLRAFMLLREIAYSYGGRPSPIARVRIMITALKNVATISLADIIITDLVGAVGPEIGNLLIDGVSLLAAAHGVPASVAGSAAKGVGKSVGVITDKAAADIAIGAVSGRRMALFGLLVVGTCRPIPLTKGRRKVMGNAVKDQLITLVKSAGKNK